MDGAAGCPPERAGRRVKGKQVEDLRDLVTVMEESLPFSRKGGHWETGKAGRLADP